MSIVDKVWEYMQQHHMLECDSKVVIGISGGADSVALLLLLSVLRQTCDFSLFAVHINHGIRKEAGQDADYVKKLCEQCSIPFYLYEADIPAMAKSQKKTEEEMGREYRYQCFFEVAKRVSADAIALAHHMGDQAETVLFHMVRGTDLSGMVGIRPVNEMKCPGMQHGRIRIIRPLLCCAKKELTDWLVTQEVIWREDATNRDVVYTRNKIRNKIVPLLEEVNAGAVSHIAELANTMGEYEAFFQHMVEEYIRENVSIIKERKKQRSCSDDRSVQMIEQKNRKMQIVCETNRDRLLEKESVFVQAVIYEMMGMVSQAKKDLTREHIRDVLRLLGKQSGKRVMLPYDMEAVVSYENLTIRRYFKEEAEEWKQEVAIRDYLFANGESVYNMALPFGGSLLLEMKSTSEMTAEQRENLLFNTENSKNTYTKFFDCDTIKDTLYVRTAEPEDYFVMNEAGDKKKLSRHFIDMKVPVERRKYTIVLAMGQEVLWVVGGRRCERFKIKDDTGYILKVTYEGESNEE